MGRHPDPDSPFRISIHKNGKYLYASTQPIRFNTKTGKNEHYRIHWGTVTSDNKFIPNATYLNTPVEIRTKLIFPDNIDLSELKIAEDKKRVEDENIKKILVSSQNFLYGDVWLLDKVADVTGIKEDLLKVFENDTKTVNDILTLSYFLFSGEKTYNHVNEWQKIEKSPADYYILPHHITKLSQSITTEDRKKLFFLRANRLDDEDLCAVDSTLYSTYGKCLYDNRYGQNKENDNLPHTIESVVYSLKKHAPIYFRSFQANAKDSRNLDVIIYELEAAGFKNITFITDRCFEKIENLKKHIVADRKIIMASKTTQQYIKDVIYSFKNFDLAPKEMCYDSKEELFYLQKKIKYQIEDEDGKLIDVKNLMLNLYFDPQKRVSERMELFHQEDVQKSTLESMISNYIVIPDKETLKEDFPLFTVEYKKTTILVKYEQKENRKNKIHIAYLDEIIDKRLSVDNKDELINSYDEYTLSFNDEAVYITKYSKNDKIIENNHKICGFFANIALNLNYDAITAYRHYQLKDEQDKYYCMINGLLNSKRERLHSQVNRDGRRFILFVAQIIGCYITYIRNEKLFNKYKNIESILNEMRSIKYIQYKDIEPILTHFSGNQVSICESFGFSIPDGCAPAHAVRKTT